MAEQDKQILVVDDNLANIQVIGPILREAGYKIRVAMSGQEGLSCARADKPNLIISDIRMPEMDGFELCAALKEDESTKEIPLIFVTASNDWEDESRGLSLGAIDFIQKPINPPVLLARVATHLNLQQALKEAQQRTALLEENAKLRDDVEQISRHDLKSPLHAILSVPQLLKEDSNLTKEQRDMLQIVEDSGFRMLDMINRSLDLYKMEVGQYAFSPKPISLVTSFTQVFESLHTLGKSTKSVLEKPVFKNDEPDIEVLGEDMLLYSLFSNLVKNALEASPQGGAVRVVVTSLVERISIEIINEGEVPLEVRENFFEKYSTAGKHTGVGIGTYSAQLITKTLGGTIHLDCSTSGQTTVQVLLPTTGE